MDKYNNRQSTIGLPISNNHDILHTNIKKGDLHLFICITLPLI